MGLALFFGTPALKADDLGDNQREIIFEELNLIARRLDLLPGLVALYPIAEGVSLFDVN